MSDENFKLDPHHTETVRVIRSLQEFVLDGFGKVTAMVAIDPAKANAANEPLTLYQGYAILGANAGGALRQFPVEFIIEGATTVEEAFDKFQEHAVKQFQRNMAEMQKRAEAERTKIITPADLVG